MIEQHPWLLFVVALVAALAVPYGFQRVVLKRSAPDPHRWRISVMKWMAILGGVGLVLGVALPIAITPGADQGPLFGALIGVPFGGLLGAAIGSWLGVDRGQRQ